MNDSKFLDSVNEDELPPLAEEDVEGTNLPVPEDPDDYGPLPEEALQARDEALGEAELPSLSEEDVESSQFALEQDYEPLSQAQLEAECEARDKWEAEHEPPA